MADLFRSIFSCFLLSLFLFTNVVSMAPAMQEELKPHVLFSPQKGRGSYGGLEHKETIEKVRVSSCVSLGGSCVDRINDVLKGADQFIVSFMYRFNSPTLIKTLGNKHLTAVPVISFLDYGQTYESSTEGSHYPSYVRRLIESVPTSLVKLGGRSFHQKVMIAKKAGEQAIVIVGSANATFEADNEHSEDIVLIQSNALALHYLAEFEKLMRMEPVKKSSSTLFSEQQVKVFHEHRVKPNESNIDFLGTLKDKFHPKDQQTLAGGHLGNVVSMAISTGFSDEGGTQTCLNIVNNALGHTENEFIFLFENFISLNEALSKEKIGENLKSKTPKLIVLDKNKHNAESLKGLGTKNNSVLLFKPFSGGKFHHKLIIQFPKGEQPIVYTGSFHISTNAVQRNSENIIGIQSETLADEYLASILLNSGLGEQPNVWKFIFDHERLRHVTVLSKPQESLVMQAARAILKKCNDNMDRYLDRLERVEAHLQMAASDHDQQLEIEKYFSHCARLFSSGDSQDKLRAIEDLKETVFKGTIAKIYLEDLDKNRQSIKGKFKEIDKLPKFDESHIENWLEEMNLWVENAKEDQKRENKVNFKDELDTIEKIYIALNDLYDYESTFERLNELQDHLKRILKL
jgi:hypothetical protein